MRSCTGSVVISSLKKRMRPAVGMKSPVMALNSVVLPAPLEPMTARRSLAAIFMVTPDSATSAPKCRATLSSSSACAPDSCKRVATDTSVTGSLSSERLRAARIIAAGLAELQEFVFRNAQRLVDLRNDLDELVGDGVAVLVERHFAGRRIKNEARQRRPQLAAAIRHIGIDLLQAGEQSRHVDVVTLREQRGGWERVRLLFARGDKLFPCRRVVVVGDRTRRRRADDD